MEKYSLVSSYTVAQYKVHRKGCNEDNIPNTVNREFKDREKLEVVVSDLTYVRVNKKWSYICTLLDLYNREIICFSAGPKKDATFRWIFVCLATQLYQKKGVIVFCF